MSKLYTKGKTECQMNIHTLSHAAFVTKLTKVNLYCGQQFSVEFRVPMETLICGTTMVYCTTQVIC